MDFNEMNKLALGLMALRVPFVVRPLWDGLQIKAQDGSWDAVYHCFSYGHERGLIEVAGTICRSDDDDVEGWLTAEEILSRF